MIRKCYICSARYEDDKIGDYGFPYLCLDCLKLRDTKNARERKKVK